MIMHGNTLSLFLPDDLKAFVEAQAAKAGCVDPAEYVCAMLREMRDRDKAGGASPDADAVAAAIAELDELRIGNRLDGLSLRELINEGRRL